MNIRHKNIFYYNLNFSQSYINLVKNVRYLFCLSRRSLIVKLLRRIPVVLSEEEESNILENIKRGYAATTPKLLVG